MKSKMRSEQLDVIDFGMGNPDGATPAPIVDKLIEAARNPRNHRYSLSRGIPNLRLEIAKRYKRNYGVEIDPDTEAIATIGAKDALAHLLFAVIGPGDAIRYPPGVRRLDYEAELGVVIGRRGKFISAEEAYDYVFGYTIVNDVSERRLEVPKEREPREGDRWFDWLNGKWFDTFAPMGPWIVTKDEIPDPHSLRISLTVNGEVMQDSNTNHMIFTVPELIQFISTLLTLEPGDVISTGTPEGTGAARGIFLKKGDLIRIKIERIGELVNPVESEMGK